VGSVYFISTASTNNAFETIRPSLITKNFPDPSILDVKPLLIIPASTRVFSKAEKFADPPQPSFNISLLRWSRTSALIAKTVLLSIQANDVCVADRNFCTLSFTCGIDSKQACFIIREHKKYRWQSCGKKKYIGKVDTGKVYQQRIKVIDGSGKEDLFRRIRVSLKIQTRDGDKEIFLITNLPKKAADATKIAKLYRGRWTIETAFQHLADHLNSEINTLGYPRAALFGFCVALVSYIVVSVIKAALGSVHGVDIIENNVSGNYVAD
jgi:hypothetical protein